MKGSGSCLQLVSGVRIGEKEHRPRAIHTLKWATMLSRQKFPRTLKAGLQVRPSGCQQVSYQTRGGARHESSTGNDERGGCAGGRHATEALGLPAWRHGSPASPRVCALFPPSVCGVPCVALDGPQWGQTASLRPASAAPVGAPLRGWVLWSK